MARIIIVLPNGNAVEATFVKGTRESDFTGSEVGQYLKRTDHFIIDDPKDGRFAIAASAVLIKLS